MRVVNALLTQIDQLKSYPNVLVLATSNLRNSIDEAFLDRADVSYEVGLPSTAATYDILYSCLMELMQKGLVRQDDTLFNYRLASNSRGANDTHMAASHSLLEVVQSLAPRSARFLRKVPFQALMRLPILPASLPDFLQALGQSCLSAKEEEDRNRKREVNQEPDLLC